LTSCTPDNEFRNSLLKINVIGDLTKPPWKVLGVRVGEKSPFPLNRSFSTRTFCKPLILPNVGLLRGLELRAKHAVGIEPVSRE
jgi:hypothetical protein